MIDSSSLHCRFTTIWPSVQHSWTKFRSPHFSLSLVNGSGTMGFPVFAMKRAGKGGISHTEQNDSDYEDFDDFFDEDEDDFEDEDEDEILLPLKNKREWNAARPRGFGEGKEYDTSIEKKLLQEIEKSREAQAANINKLKNQSSSDLNSGRNFVEIEAPEIVSTGVRVRIVNLPKKKNIHRDLIVAFKGFPGIINITPAVIGNKKTRDPICKGFAFVDCKSEGDAISFLQAFSGRYLTFGRVQKQIKCEIINRQTSSSVRKSSVGSTNHSQLSILEGEAALFADMDVDIASEFMRTRIEDIEEDNLANVSELHLDEEDDHGVESRTESKIQSPSQNEVNKIHEVEIPQEREEVRREISRIKEKTKVSMKKKQPKEKGAKKSLIEIPGSAKRLRIKEKAVLTDVYSRYGNKSASIRKEGN